MKRVVLTKSELNAIISIAGDADARASIECITTNDDEAERILKAFEAGMGKLRIMLSQRESRRSIADRSEK